MMQFGGWRWQRCTEVVQQDARGRLTSYHLFALLGVDLYYRFPFVLLCQFEQDSKPSETEWPLP